MHHVLNTMIYVEDDFKIHVTCKQIIILYNNKSELISKK